MNIFKMLRVVQLGDELRIYILRVVEWALWACALTVAIVALIQLSQMPKNCSIGASDYILTM